MEAETGTLNPSAYQLSRSGEFLVANTAKYGTDSTRCIRLWLTKSASDSNNRSSDTINKAMLKSNLPDVEESKHLHSTVLRSIRTYQS